MPHDPLDIENYANWLNHEATKEQSHYNKLLPAIGSATLAFAHLEWKLNQAFGQVINDRSPEIGLRIADKLSYSQTVDHFETICGELTKAFRLEIRNELTRLIQDLRNAGRLRNEVAHSSFEYVFGSDGQFLKTPSRVKSKKKERRSHIVDPLPEIEASIVTICQTEESLTSFVDEYL